MEAYVIVEIDEFGGSTVYPMVFADFQDALAEAYNTAEYKFYKSGSYNPRQVLCVQQEENVVVYRTDRRPYEVVRRFDIEKWAFIG